MQKSDANSVQEYLDDLPPERRETVAAVRQVILDNLPTGYEETFDFGMVAYVVPPETYPKTYNGHPLMYAALASQKRHVALYLMNIYADPETERWFAEGYQASGKKLDMGKACVRFKSLDDLPMALIGSAIARTSVAEHIQRYEASRQHTVKGRKKDATAG